MRRLLLLTLIVPMLAACGTTAQQANVPDETSAETVLYSTAEAPTTEEETTTAESQTAAEMTAPVGGSVAQIVEFYNKQANAVKAADRITITKHNVREMTMEVPALLKALMPKEADDLMNQNKTTTETFVNGKGTEDASRRLNDFLPVNGTPYVSTLKASHVQSASCAQQGEGWVVRINLKDEKMDMAAMQQNAMNMDMENISEADREKMLNDMFADSGYYACMDMGLGDDMPERDASQGPNIPGFINPQSMMDSMNMDAGFQNGAVAAIFDEDGKLASLTLSYTNYSRVSFLGMKMGADSAAKQQYQFTW